MNTTLVDKWVLNHSWWSLTEMRDRILRTGGKVIFILKWENLGKFCSCVLWKRASEWWNWIFGKAYFFLFFKRFYLFIYERHREREAESEAKGEAGSLWGAWCRTWSQDPGSRPEPKADAQPLSHSGVPRSEFCDGAEIDICDPWSVCLLYLPSPFILKMYLYTILQRG